MIGKVARGREVGLPVGSFFPISVFRYHNVIFVHGCFWHGHAHCHAFRLPKSRCDFWQTKIEGNQARDLRNETALLQLGWHVVIIWECALKTGAARSWLTNQLPELLGKPCQGPTCGQTV